MAPTWRKEPFDDPDWLFDCKYDGFRALYYIEPGHNRLISRNGNLLTRFDALGGALAAELSVDDAIIDGEVIAADETVIALQHSASECGHLRAFVAEQGHCRRFRLRLVQLGEVAAGDLAKHGHGVADSALVAAEGTVREDCLVIRPRNPVFSAGGHHEAGKSTQIPQFGGRQLGSEIVDRAHHIAPMVRPRNDVAHWAECA